MQGATKWTLSGTLSLSEASKTTSRKPTFALCHSAHHAGRFLAYVDLQGTTYTSPSIATGYGAPIAQPLLRKVLDDNNGSISREVAEQAILQSMQVLFYRDARSINKFQIADINKDGVTISKPRSVPTSWGFAEGLRGYGAQEQ
jgi:20S proteasome subunit beta 7